MVFKTPSSDLSTFTCPLQHHQLQRNTVQFLGYKKSTNKLDLRIKMVNKLHFHRIHRSNIVPLRSMDSAKAKNEMNKRRERFLMQTEAARY